MAGPTVKEILLRWGIDNSNWKAAIQELAQLLEKSQATTAKAQAQAQQQLEQQKQKLKEIVDARKSEAAEIDKQIEKQKLLAATAAATRQEVALKLAQEKLVAAELEKQITQHRLAAAESAKVKTEAAGRLVAEKALAAEIDKQSASQRVLQATQRTLQAELNTRLLQERLITAEHQKQAAEIRKQITQQNLRKSLTSGATVAAGIPASQAAAMQLRLAMAQDEKISSSLVLAERQKIVAQVDKEIAALKAKALPEKEEQAQLARLLSLRQQQTSAIAAQHKQEETGAAARQRQAQQAQAAAARIAAQQKPAAGSSQAVAALALRQAQGEQLSRHALALEHEKIVALLKQELAAMGPISSMNDRQLAQLRAKTAQLQQQVQLGKGQATGGAGGNLLSQFATGFTSRLFGTLTFAVFTAEGLGRVLESATMKMKEFIESTGPLTQVREQFQKLALTQNIDPSKYITSLRVATKGLIEDVQLYRTANLALQSSLGASSQDVIKLTEATVGLARAQGKDANQALQALDMFLTTGYGRSLAHVTGLQSQMLMGVRSLGGGFDQTARLGLNFKQALELITRQYTALGAPAMTYTEQLKALEVAQHRVMEEFALGLQSSTGFKQFVSFIGEGVEKLNSFAEAAGGWGEKLGEVFVPVTQWFRDLWATAEAFWKSVVAVFTIVGDLISLVLSPIDKLSGGIGSLGQRFTTLHGILGTLAEYLAWATFQMQTFGNVIEFVGKSAVPALTGAFAKVSENWQQMNKANSASFLEFKARVAEAERLVKGLPAETVYKLTYAAPPVGQTELQQMEAEKRIAKVREELAIKSSQIQLEVTQNRIKEEESLLQTQYEEGLVSVHDYVTQKMRLEDENHRARLAQMKEEYDAKRAYTQKETEVERMAAQFEIAKAKLDLKNQTEAQDKQLKDKIEQLHRETSGKAVPGAIEGADASSQTQIVAADNQLTASKNQLEAAGKHAAASDSLHSIGKLVKDFELGPTRLAAEAVKGVGGKAGIEDTVGSAFKTLADQTTKLGRTLAGVKIPEKLSVVSSAVSAPEKAAAPASLVPIPVPFGMVGPTTGEKVGGEEVLRVPPEEAEKSILANRKANQTLIENSYKAQLLVAKSQLAEAQAKLDLITKEEVSARLKEAAEYLKAQKANLEIELKDEIAVRKTLADTEAKIARDNIAIQKDITEDEFKTGEIGAQEYLNKRVGYIEAEYKATEAAEKRKLDIEGKTNENLARQAEAMAEAAMTREKELTKLKEQEFEIRTKAEEKAFGNSQKLLDAQLSYQKQQTPFVGEQASNAAQAATLQTIVHFTEQHLAMQELEVARLKATNQEWYDQQLAVMKTREELLKYNEELIKTTVPLQGIGTLARNLAEGFGSLRGRGMQNAAQALGQFASRIDSIQKQAMERNLRTAQPGGGGILGYLGIRQPAVQQILSPADQERALSESLSKADSASQQVGSIEQALKSAISGTTGSVADWNSKITEMAATAAKAIDVINQKLAALPAQEEAGQYIPLSRAKGDLVAPHAATGATVSETGLAVIHAGEQVSPVSEVMGLVSSVKMAATELEKFSSELTKLTTALAKLGEGPYAGRPKAEVPTTAQRASAALVSPLRNLAAGIVGGPTAGAPQGSMFEQLFGAQPYYPGTAGGAPVKKTFAQEWFGQPQPSAGLSGPPVVGRPGTLTASDMGAAGATLASADTTEMMSNPLEISNAAITQNVGAVQAQTAATQQLTPDTTAAAGGASTMAGGLTGLSGMLGQATQVVGGFQQALSGAGGPAKSALAGAGAGFQLGSMIPGPAGAVVGGVAAGVGAIIGVFSGKAEEQTQKVSKELIAAFQAVGTEVQNGSQTLVGGIQSMQALITTTVSELTGAKGGKQELEALLPQMEQSLTALQQQQQSILKAFDEKLEVASAPTAYQDSLSQIQSIIDQYQQYIQAGGSVANANQFLQQSFQSLAQQGINSLNQSEQDAINNALNYNDLLLQRQNLIQSTNLQIQSIMNQGVAVRQTPEGVTKAVQIEQVVQQATNQQDQLNEEISVSQYKLQNEQQIFNLATTRIGLEQQLVILQNQQTNQQLEQVEALGSVVSSLKTALPTSMPAALNQLGLGAAYVPPEAAEAPTPPVKTGIMSVDEQNELQYQQALAAYEQNVNQPVGYINPAGSPAGTEQTGVASGLYTGPTPGVPTTTPIPTTIGATASQEQIQQALAIIKAGTVGQPMNPEPSTGISIGTGLPGPTSLDTADIVSTPDGNAMLVTSTVGSFAAQTAAVRNVGTGTGAGAGAVPSSTAQTIYQQMVSQGVPAGLAQQLATKLAAQQQLGNQSPGGGGSTTEAPTPLPSNLTLYGTDASGNPVYTDANGNLYSASGQSIGNVGVGGTPPIYRPQPQPGGGGPPAGPITLPTPLSSGGLPMPQIPGAGGVPGTGIQGVTVNPDGSLSFAQLPSSVLTETNIGIGPGAVQATGIVGTPPEVQAAITPEYAGLAGTGVVPSIVEPQPITSGGQPGSPGSPTILPPFAPTVPSTDVSSLVAALNAAVSGDVNAEKVTMNDFIAILNNVNSVGLQPTITQLQSFLDTFKKHSGVESRASQNAMQMVINQLQAIANAQPAPIAPLPASPAPVTTAPTTGIGTVTGLPRFPSTGGVITPTPIVGGGGGLPVSPYTASNTGGIIPTLGGMLSAAPTAASGFLGSVASSLLPPSLGGSTVGGATVGTPAGTSSAEMATLAATNQRVTLEQQISTLSSARVASETQLVSLKMQEIQADLARVAAHTTLINLINNSKSSSSTMEDLLNKVYQTRGRQGFGSFYGEVSSPV